MLQHARGSVACRAEPGNPRTTQLRKLLREPGILKGPCCHDGLSARLIEKSGFPFTFMSGFATAGARLGAPDTGLITYSEMVDTCCPGWLMQGRNIHEATSHIPVIGDGDTGYGNALNVQRTVKGYAKAGFAGILIEDQAWPKSCGHLGGKQVVSREEAVARVKAAVDAREAGADLLVVARTDARQALSMEEALWRVAAFADAGADILFIDALETAPALLASSVVTLPHARPLHLLCHVHRATATSSFTALHMANMLEGGGKTPILPPQQLHDMGFKLVAYPLSLLSVSIKAMEQALAGLQQGQLPHSSAMASLPAMLDAVGFPEYSQRAKRYAVNSPSSTSSSSSSSSSSAASAASYSASSASSSTAPPAAAPSTPPPLSSPPSPSPSPSPPSSSSSPSPSTPSSSSWRAADPAASAPAPPAPPPPPPAAAPKAAAAPPSPP
ncbi:Pyruvate/Phosphoenolpyruvate kinase-like domain-containing protein, partial [Haematococcus lacustris]